MIASAKRRCEAYSVSRVIDGIDPGTFYRARRSGGLGYGDFDLLLKQCEVELQPLFQSRWRNLQERRLAGRRKRSVQALLTRTSVLTILQAKKKGTDYWPRLATVLTMSKIGQPWPPDTDNVSSLIEQCVENERLIGSQEQGLRNALIFVNAWLTTDTQKSTTSTLTLLSAVVAALKVAGLLGHRRAMRRMLFVLEEMHRTRPYDEQILRVLLCCRALNLEHHTARKPYLLRDSIGLHNEEAKLAAKCITDPVLTRDWPVIYREVRGSIWNFMNVRLDAGLGVALDGSWFQRHIEWQATTEACILPGYRLADNPHLAIEVAAYDIRFRVSVLLDRPDRSRSLKGGQPEQALAEVDTALLSATMRPHLNELTIGHLLGLRAEALLCLYGDRPNSTRKEEYIIAREAASSAYRAVGDEANSEFWQEKITKLEKISQIDY